jgi:hypothetical protein
MDVLVCFLFLQVKKGVNACRKVTKTQRSGEISRLGNVKKNESDKWSGWQSEEEEEAREREGRRSREANEMEEILSRVWKTWLQR